MKNKHLELTEIFSSLPLCQLQQIYGNYISIIEERITAVFDYFSEYSISRYFNSIIERNSKLKSDFLGSPDVYRSLIELSKNPTKYNLMLVQATIFNEFLAHGVIEESEITYQRPRLEFLAYIDEDLKLNSIKLSNSICLQYRNEIFEFDHDLGVIEAYDYDESEAIYIGKKIIRALSFIGQRNKGYWHVINIFVRKISIKKYSGQFISGSRRDTVGCIGLLNPHLASEEELVEALIHESIHSMLYCIEHISPFFQVEASYGKFKSPWTGRYLQLHSYVHACFVWYSIYMFTRSLVRKTPKWLEICSRSKLGFQQDLTRVLESAVDGQVVRVIDELKLIIQGCK